MAQIILYTLGYGRCTKDEFIERLNQHFPTNDAYIVDVRKCACKSVNGKWAWWGGLLMGATVLESGNEYATYPELANHYGKTQRAMEQYEKDLHSGDLRIHLDALAKGIYDNPNKHYCLLCSERAPFTKAGKRNCHRTLIAQNVTARIWYDYHTKIGLLHL